MDRLPAPPVPDLARVVGETRDEVAQWLRDYYTEPKAFFNYLCATKIVKESYRGFHNLPQLLAGCNREKSVQGKKSNEEVVACAAPLAFGRGLQVFDLPSRQFVFGRDRKSAFRTPFFFVEHDAIRLYFLQPRKGFVLTQDQLGMVATIHKRFLLDVEFFGEPSDIEYVDLRASSFTKQREISKYNLSDLTLWSEQRLLNRLTLISEAIEFLEKQGVQVPSRVRRPTVSPDLPMF